LINTWHQRVPSLRKRRWFFSKKHQWPMFQQLSLKQWWITSLKILMRKMMKSCKILMLPKLRLEASIRQRILKWSLTKKIRSTWSIISHKTKCKVKRETLMITKLHKFQNRELIRLLKTQKKLKSQSLNRLIQVNFNKMSLQQQLRKLSLCKMIKLMLWRRSQQKKVHLS